MALIPFGEFAPDQPDFGNGGVTQALNIYPIEGGYGPVRDLVTITDALDARAQGAASLRQSTGVTHGFAGDVSKLYKLSVSTWSDVSRVGGYATAASGQWRFVRFGDNVLAANGADDIQVFNLDTDVAFSDLAGSPPTATHMAVIREFVVVSDLGDADFPIKWCDQNDITNWSTGQSDQQPLPDGGQVKGITGGDFGLIFQENAIRRLQFAGPPVIFQVRPISEDVGCQIDGSIVKFGKVYFFKSSSGFYLTDGFNLTRIGDGKIDKHFDSLADPEFYSTMSAGVDHRRKLIIWNYVTKTAQNGIPDRQLIFNLSDGRWSESLIENEYYYSDLAVSTTLEDLDTISTDLDALGISLDSSTFLGGARNIGAFDITHSKGALDGATLAATLQTGETQLTDGRRTFLNSVRPVVDALASVRVGSRNRQVDPVLFTSVAAMNVSGTCPLRANGRYQRAEVTVPASTDWTIAQGIEPEGAQRGRR